MSSFARKHRLTVARLAAMHGLLAPLKLIGRVDAAILLSVGIYLH